MANNEVLAKTEQTSLTPAEVANKAFVMIYSLSVKLATCEEFRDALVGAMNIGQFQKNSFTEIKLTKEGEVYTFEHSLNNRFDYWKITKDDPKKASSWEIVELWTYEDLGRVFHGGVSHATVYKNSPHVNLVSDSEKAFKKVRNFISVF